MPVKKSTKKSAKKTVDPITEAKVAVLKRFPDAFCTKVKDKYIILKEKTLKSSDFSGALCRMSGSESDAWKKSLHNIL